MFDFIFNKERPDLINILNYTYLIYGEKCVKMPLTKPAPIPERCVRETRGWTKKEMTMMEQNRIEAQALYDEIKAY